MVRWAGGLLARRPVLGALLVGVGMSTPACSRSPEEPLSAPHLALDPSGSDWNQFLKLPAFDRSWKPTAMPTSWCGSPSSAHQRGARSAPQVPASRWPWVGPVLWYFHRDAGNDRSDVVKLRVLTSGDELASLRQGWDELNEAAGARPFTGWSWCSTWWRHLGRGRLNVVVCEESGVPVALAPLHERWRLGLRLTRFLGHGLGSVSEVVVAPGHEDAGMRIWKHLLSSPNRFLELLEYDAHHAGLVNIALASASTQVEVRDRCPVIALKGSWDEYLKSRSKSLRRALRVGEQRLADEGSEHRTEVVTTPERLEAVLPEVKSVYDLAERAAPRQHFLAGPLAGFTRQLLGLAAEEDRLRLFVSRVDGKPVSFDMAFAAGRRLSVWVGRFDPAFAQLSPGHLSQRAIMERAFEEGHDEVDLLLGDHAYKRRWSTGEYETLSVYAASTGLGLGAGRALLGAGARGARLSEGSGLSSALREAWSSRGRPSGVGSLGNQSEVVS